MRAPRPDSFFFDDSELPPSTADFGRAGDDADDSPDNEAGCDASVESFIEAYFDRDLSPAESCAVFRELCRRPDHFRRVVEDQAWIDELRAPVSAPSLAREVLARLGLDPALAYPQRQLRIHRRLARWANHLGIAAVVTVAVSVGVFAYVTRPRPLSPYQPTVMHVSAVFDRISADVNPARHEVVGAVVQLVNQVATFVGDDMMAVPQSYKMPSSGALIPTFRPGLRADPLHSVPSDRDVPRDLDDSAVGPMNFG